MPGWLELYVRGERLLEGGVSVVRGAWDGLWLGVLTEAQLARLDERYYDGQEMYRSEAWNRSGFQPWEEQLVDAHFPAGGRVVVLGAGGGREVLELLARGHDAWGHEPNAALASAGSVLTAADGHGARVLPSARSAWPDDAGRADAVLLGWGSYMLVPTRAQRVALLRAASAATGDRGPVAFSYFPMPPGRRQFWVTARVAGLLRRLRGAPPPLLGDALSPNFVHHFTGRQVREEVEAAGLVLVARGTGDYGWAVARRGTTAGGRTT
ncbi:hypothetical protein [Modestobacter versicolor]|uniref:hypothetical protein n=1 Tax=Modestobacter versicolor TaxID=429133 RepID=UPI0034DEF0B0